jgi:hypothetical protein
MSDRDSREGEQQRYLDGVEAVRVRLMALPNVVEVGVGLKETGGQLTDEIVIHVFVSEKVPTTKLAPDQIEIGRAVQQECLDRYRMPSSA